METLQQQLKQLSLSHAAMALEQQISQLSTYAELSFDERLSLLLEHEILHRRQNKIERHKRLAKLRLNANPSELIYTSDRGLQRAQVAELLTGTYLHRQQNIVITGATGTGKTFLACALASHACEQQFTARYYRLSRLLDDLCGGRIDGSYQKQLNALGKKTLLVIDDWGMEKLQNDTANLLLELIEDRYKISSTIIVSQLPIKLWHQLIPNPTIADALMDRLIHHSHRIELKGESMRKMAQIDHLS